MTSYEKCLLLKINTVTEFLLFRMKYIIDGDFYLIIDTYSYYPYAYMNLLIYLLLNCLCYFFLSVKLLFLMPSETCKEYRKY